MLWGPVPPDSVCRGVVCPAALTWVLWDADEQGPAVTPVFWGRQSLSECWVLGQPETTQVQH